MIEVFTLCEVVYKDDQENVYRRYIYDYGYTKNTEL